MTTPLSETIGIQTTAHNLRDMSQQQRVQKILQQIPPGSAAAARQPQMEELVKPVQKVNETLKPYGVQFELMQEVGRVVTRLVDQESGDVIRQIPSEAVLEIMERLHDLSGLVFSEQA